MNPQKQIHKENKPKQAPSDFPPEVKEVRDNEEASLPDQSYAFDESNTDNEEYHDVDDDFEEDIDYED